MHPVDIKCAKGFGKELYIKIQLALQVVLFPFHVSKGN